MQQRQAQMDPARTLGKTMAESSQLAARPSTMPTTEPLPSRTSMRPSAAERICFACTPSATRILNSRSRFRCRHGRDSFLRGVREVGRQLLWRDYSIEDYAKQVEHPVA